MPKEKNDVCLTLENVSKVFARVESDEVTHALQDVSVTMKSGEFVSLVGPPAAESPRSFALWQGSSHRRSAALP